jgi:protein ImuA
MRPAKLEDIHPSLWRGTQLARSFGRVVDTGYAAMSAELPGGGWPVGTLIELLVQQSGIAVGKRPIALVQPVQIPNSLAFSYLGVDPSKLLWLRTSKSADALWTVEQILKAGSCGAVLFWQQHVRSESLRRLLLAAQTSETLFVMFRPLACAADSSPASLRIALRPSEGGVSAEIIKRKGPISNTAFVVPIEPSSILTRSQRTHRKLGKDQSQVENAIVAGA